MPVIGLRLSFSGQLAWELQAPSERLGEFWDALYSAGEALGIILFGSMALDMLRLEKVYRGGHELVNDVSPVQSGQMRLVRLDKAFIGREVKARR